MTFPTITAFYAAILGLIYAGLSGWVIGGRLGGNVLFGDGGQDGLQRRIRSHANFQEYVPLTLILIVMILNLIGRLIARRFAPKTGR